VPSVENSRFCRLAAASAVVALLACSGCDKEEHKPSEGNTYNVHLYYGKDVSEDKYLGQVVGISQCQMKVHGEAARMGFTGHTYSYACCWVHEGNPCFEKHK
jgi:hypothetical protein